MHVLGFFVSRSYVISFRHHGLGLVTATSTVRMLRVKIGMDTSYIVKVCSVDTYAVYA